VCLDLYNLLNAATILGRMTQLEPTYQRALQAGAGQDLGRRARWWALLACVALALAHTWPLATAPATLSRNDNPDTVLNEWAIAWIAHEAPRDPIRLFDANIFYPDRRTLAYSEPLLVPAVMGAPLLWAGASPVLVYNLLVIAGFSLTAWTVWLVITRWTGDPWSGVLAGSLVAFNAHTMARLPHLQALHAEFLPLALLALDELLRVPRTSASLRLALWFVLQALTSIYSMVFTVVALAAGWLVRPRTWTGPQSRRIVAHVVLAGALAGLVLGPVLLVYSRVGVVRSLEEVASLSASWRNYLVTPALLHGWWSWQIAGAVGGALFPGFVALLLASVQIANGTAWREERPRMALAFGMAGLALSLGPALPGYSTLYRFFPLLQAVRTAARFGYLALVSVGLLAGFGFAQLRARWRTARWLPLATIAVITAVNVESCAAPVEYVSAQPVPAPYERLRTLNRAVVAEFPFFAPGKVFHNAEYMLNSASHWQPILNGYSGITPASYIDHYEALREFPDGESIEALRAIGVTHVVVHERSLADWTDTERVERVRRVPGLRSLESDGDVVVYALVQNP
jgi:hypothetical protein